MRLLGLLPAILIAGCAPSEPTPADLIPFASVCNEANEGQRVGVRGYLRLPREWADTRPIEGGKTALMVLVDQLELLASTMSKMLDAANRADAEALIAHGRFLEAKFGHASSGGTLDTGGTLPTPPPPPRSTLDLE